MFLLLLRAIQQKIDITTPFYYLFFVVMPYIRLKGI